MNFPEYLKERISEDYKNVIIQKLEEIKGSTDDLKTSISPVADESGQSVKSTLQQEISRIQEFVEKELNNAQQKFVEQFQSRIDDSLSSWYHSDISAFQQQLELTISDIISNVPPPPKKENEGLSSLAQLMHKLDQGNTQSEILNIVLQHIADWVNRAVLFVVKGDQATAWAGFGLGSDWDSNRIRQVKISLGSNNLLKEVSTSGQAAFGPADKYSDNSQLFGMIGSSEPKTALAFPVMIRGKIAGILYADMNEDLSENPDLPNLLYLASRAAGYAIDLLPTKTKGAAVPAPPASAVPSIPVSAVPVEEPSVTPEPAVVAAVEPEPVQASSAAELIQEATLEEEEEPETAGTVVMPAFRPEVQSMSDEDQRLHDDAKRFARLLVSEIKLYNEAQVAAGREKRDLYERLKDDIERSRKMYMDRVPQHIHSHTNYFFEELVKTLANGDPTLLGM